MAFTILRGVRSMAFKYRMHALVASSTLGVAANFIRVCTLAILFSIYLKGEHLLRTKSQTALFLLTKQ
jgi:hypothetical protein